MEHEDETSKTEGSGGTKQIEKGQFIEAWENHGV